MIKFARKIGMSTLEIENILNGGGIKPTANRILVLREIMKASHPISLSDLEISLSPMDKSSIFRTLDLFSKHDLIHVIEDGSRSLKYEVCHGNGHHTVADQHAHFYCEKCGEVYCLDDITIPHTNLPATFTVKSVNLMFKGICAKCSHDN